MPKIFKQQQVQEIRLLHRQNVWFLFMYLATALWYIRETVGTAMVVVPVASGVLGLYVIGRNIVMFANILGNLRSK